MDAAFAAFKKTAFFLALALTLLALVPRPAQAQAITFTSPTAGAAYNLVSGGLNEVLVTGSADSSTPIQFTVAIAYATGDAAWLSVGGGGCTGGSTPVYSTPITVGLSAGCYAGQLASGSHTATVTFTGTNYPSNNPTVSFTVTYNTNGTSTGTLVPNPANLTGTYALSAVSGSQTSATVSLTTTSVSVITFTTSSAAGWLTVEPGSGSASATQPGTLNMVASALGLSPAQYNTTATVYYGGNQQLVINVTFNVSASGVSLSPSSLAWTYASGALSPTGAQNLTLSTPNGDSYTATVSYPAGATATNWLLVNNGSSLSGLENGSIFAVSVTNYSSLANGTYTGSIIVTDPNNSADYAALTVTLTVGTASTSLTVSPNPIGLSSSNGYEQLATVTSGAGGALSVSVSSANGWLSATTTTSTIAAGGSAYVTVSANTSLSGSGVYTGTLTVTVGTASVQVTVNLNAGSSTTVTSSGYVAPTTLNFVGESGGSNVSQQIVFVGSGTFQIATAPTYVGSGNTIAWLQPASQEEGTMTESGSLVTLRANPSQLTPGTYTATLPVTVAPDGAQNSTVSLKINFVVSSSEVLAATPGTLLFTNATTSPTSTVGVIAVGGSTALPLSVTADQGWLTAQLQGGATTTPATITATANTGGMSNGLYAANIVVTSGASPTLYIPVLVAVSGVSNPSGLTPSSPSLTFTAQVGAGSPASQTLTVSSDPTGVSFGATASGTSSGGITWLSVAPTTDLTTNQQLTVSVSTAGLTAGTYSGSIALTANGATVYVPVSLVLSTSGGGSGGNITLSTNTLNFTAVYGGAAPAAQTLTVSSQAGSAGVAFTATATSPGNWLAVSPASGTTQTTLSVTVNQANLTVGDHSGSITITPTGGTAQVVQVTLDVVSEPTVTVSPASLTFAYQAGSGSIVSPGQLTVTASGGTASFVASASSTGNWLSVTPTSGVVSTATTLAVQVSPASLAASSTPYTGTITITAVNGSAGSVTVNVRLTVTAPLPVISAVLNAGSFGSGPVSPGEIVSIFGTSLGPVAPATLTLTSAGMVSTSIGGVTVSFSGYLAPLIYVSSTQINAIVPYELASNKGPFVEVIFEGQKSNEPSLQLATSAPGIFTLNGSGSGPGAILNQNYSVNTQTNPAAAGSVVQIYMTGEGLTTPAQATGTVTTANLSGVGPVTPAPQLAVSALIGGQPAQVEFAGEAPLFVAGVLQVNAVIPATASSGANSITVQIGKVISQSGVTVWVK